MPWHERTLISVNPLFTNGLRREKAKPRTPSLEETMGLAEPPKAGPPAEIIDRGANLVVLFKLTRASLEAGVPGSAPPRKDGGGSGEAGGTGGLLPLWTIEGCLQQSLSRTRSEVAHAVQQSMADLFPWLRTGDTRLFGDVPSICAALSSTALPLLKPQFVRAKDGLDLDAFVEILFRQLASQEPRLRDEIRSKPFV